jgi:hypothetical protein
MAKEKNEQKSKDLFEIGEKIEADFENLTMCSQ